MAKVALLVGVSEYEPGLNPLPGSVKDVDAMQRVLAHPDLGGFAETDITVLKNPQRQAMEDAIYSLFSDRKKDDLLLFYFSGHGIKDENGRLYLATRATRKDSNGRLVPPSAVAAASLHENINASKSQRQVMILDCCFSGAIAQGMTVKDDGTVNLKDYLGGKGRAILTSSTSTEYSFGSATPGHEDEGLSIYTRYLVEGIEKGAADTDGDGWIAVEELHEYAANRVKEAAPAMTPKFYPVEEGYKIVLARSRKDDPKLKYRKEAQARAEQGQGQFSIIAQRLLGGKRIEWGISAEEAKAIEDEVLQPYREYELKQQEYEQTLAQVVQAGYPLSATAEAELKEYQQHLGLRDSDIAAIEARILAPLRAQVTQQSEVYQQNLLQYEQALADAIQQGFPFSHQTRQELGNLQQSLGLRDEDVARIEQPICEPLETKYQEKLRQQETEKQKVVYQQNLQQYERELKQTIQTSYPLGSTALEYWKNYQQSLKLKDEDVERISQPIFERAEAKYQENLKQQEETEQQRQRELGERRKAEQEKLRKEAEKQQQEQEKAEHKNKLQRYNQEFTKAIQAEYPLNQSAMNGLKSLQQQLGLKDEDVARVEQPIREPAEAKYREKLKHQEKAEQQRKRELEDRRKAEQEKLRQEAERQTQEQEKAEYENKLRRYEQEFTKAVQAEYPLSFKAIDSLRNLQKLWGLKQSDTARIEENLLQQIEGKSSDIKKDHLLSSAREIQRLLIADLEIVTVSKFKCNWLGQPVSVQLNRHNAEKVIEGIIENLGEDLTLEMIKVPGFTFLMGASEIGQVQLKLQSFFIGMYPVTQAQWLTVASFPKIERELNPNPSSSVSENLPVTQVSWGETIEFCARLTQKTGLPYRLPSEAEWEFACRADTTTNFYFGEVITTDLANYNGEKMSACGVKGEYRQQTTPVGNFPPNAFGLHDMHGNVWEWCLDYWHEDYKGMPTDGSAWTMGGDSDSYILRGGSWADLPGSIRSASRGASQQNVRAGNIGFRLALSSIETNISNIFHG